MTIKCHHIEIYWKCMSLAAEVDQLFQSKLSAILSARKEVTN